MQFKKCKIVMLPTEKASDIGLYLNSNELILITHNKLASIPKYQHLYIISDDKIKECDYYLQDNKYIYKGGDSTSLDTERCKKIIATIGESLVIDTQDFDCKGAYKYPGACGLEQECECYYKNKSLPKPSETFIEMFIENYNKGNIITDVMVEYENGYIENKPVSNGVLKINPEDNTITIHKIKDTWNREEVINLIQKLETDGADYFGQNFLKQWIENNL